MIAIDPPSRFVQLYIKAKQRNPDYTLFLDFLAKQAVNNTISNIRIRAILNFTVPVAKRVLPKKP